jgi:uncharacterized membrane protein YkvA (DUF1232 family)
MTEGQQRSDFDKDFVRRGAESITEDQVREVSEREAEIRARFERPGPIGRVLSDVNLLLALIKDYWNNEYRQAPWWVIAAVTFCFLYVVNPIDLLPDWVPILGQIDDLVVITVCLMLIEQELQEYKRWKLEQVRGD